MAVIKGNAGALKLTTNTVAELKDWSLEVSQDYVDTTAFGDTFREQTPTFASWSASASGSWDITDTNGQAALQTAWLAGSTVTPRFYVDSTHYYSGLAYVSANISAAVDNVVTISYSFTSAGALTYT
jgi:predicted secreted protein